jgi:2-dehydro-3-deoxygluconokinase
MVVLGAVQTPEKRDLIALGETMVLFLAQQPGPLREAFSFSRHVAGAESNVAVGMCRLGGSAGFVSRVGDDEFGRLIQMRLRGEGVDVSRLVTDGSAPTGVSCARREVGPGEALLPTRVGRRRLARRPRPEYLAPTHT